MELLIGLVVILAILTGGLFVLSLVGLVVGLTGFLVAGPAGAAAALAVVAMAFLIATGLSVSFWWSRRS